MISGAILVLVALLGFILLLKPAATRPTSLGTLIHGWRPYSSEGVKRGGYFEFLSEKVSGE